MPLHKEFDGKPIRKTMRVGDQVAISFHGPEKGRPGERILVPLDQYLARVKSTYIPRHRQSNTSPSASIDG